MTVRAFFAHHCRASNALSFFLSLLLLLPSFSVVAQPSVQTARQVKPHTSPKTQDKPVDQLKVGDVIPARSNATGKVEWKQVTHASKRTVPSLLSVQLTDVRTGKPAETLTCPLDEAVKLSSGKAVPAGRLSVGNCIVTRAGPVCKVKALFLLRKPGGFVLCDVRVGPLSAAKAKLLALSQGRQAQSDVRFADYKIPSSRVSYAAPASASTGLFNPFLFQGQQYDPASGDYYLRARYYDPTVGRFLSPDPFAGLDVDPLSLHRYLYAKADPVNNVDPSGNDTIGEVSLTTTQGIYLQENNASTQVGAYSRVVGQITGRVPVYPPLPGIGTPGIGTAANPFLGPVAAGAASSLFQRLVAFGLAGSIAAPSLIAAGGAGIPNGGAVDETLDGGTPTIYLVHGTTLTVANTLLSSPPLLIPPGYNTSGGGFFTALDDINGPGREYAEDYAHSAASSSARQGEGGPALIVIGVPTDVFIAATPAQATTRTGRITTEYGFLDHGPKAFGFDALVQQWSQYSKYVIPLGP
jgi:RHS repeat-associated protein